MGQDMRFDYEGKAKAVREAQRALHQFVPGEVYTTNKEQVSVWRNAINDAYPPGFWKKLVSCVTVIPLTYPLQ